MISFVQLGNSLLSCNRSLSLVAVTCTGTATIRQRREAHSLSQNSIPVGASMPNSVLCMMILSMNARSGVDFWPKSCIPMEGLDAT